FLQEMLGFSDRFFLTLGGRVDGNSSFGEDFGYQFYPKVSAAWVMSEQSWWPTNAIETFKLRAAAGESGKAPGAFDALRTWTPVAGDEGKPGFTPAQLGNPTLGPERTREFEVGFDLSTLEGRLGFELTGYSARTEDALIGVNYPPSEGFTAPQLENVGTVETQGLEMSINAGIIQSSKVDWNIRVNFSQLRSEAIDVGDVPIDVSNGAQVRNGYPVPGYWGRKIQNPDDFANPIVSDTAEYLGRVYPNQIWGLQTTLALFRRVTIDALGEIQSGANLANWVGYQNANRGIWQPCYATQAKLRDAAAGNASALDDVTALERGRCAIDRTVQNDRFWIEPSDFFKIRNLSLTYDASSLIGSKMGARNVAVTAAVRNLFTDTDYSGSDPEVTDARDSGPTALGRRDYYNLAPLRTFFFSVRMGF
ncbi:MAG: TonB-dependent outer membrane protein, SusC/RagA, partial [Gemmatimonadetes bacterium]|nr:TonB-dependent outer membrane protein, SusC/RagA [Gemmatimonadota bacterium]